MQWFLRHVSLSNRSSSAIIDIGRAELSRAAASRQLTRQKNDAAKLPPLTLFPTLDAQRNATLAASKTLKRFLRTTALLDLPE